MPSDKWVDRFMRLAQETSTWSKDTKCQVGAVLALDREIVSLGYNGPRAGINDEEVLKSPDKNKHIVHAEINALQRSQKHWDHGVKPFQIYVTKAPCCNCADKISPHVDAVYIPKLQPGSKWFNEQLDAVTLLTTRGVKVYYVEFHFDARGNRTISINDAEVLK